MSQFLNRLMHYVATEVITKGLSESKAFQRFAVATHKHVEKAKGAVADPRAAEEIIKAAQRAASDTSSRLSSAGTGDGFGEKFGRFQRALSEEISKDFRKK